MHAKRKNRPGAGQRSDSSRPQHQQAAHQQPPPQKRTVAADGVYNNPIFIHAVSSQLGNTVHLQTRSGAVYEGIFTTFSPQFNVLLEMAHRVEKDSDNVNVDTVVEKYIFKPSDIVSMVAKDVDPEFATRDTFEIDTAISSRYNGTHHDQKPLERWDSADDSLQSVCLELDSNANGWDADEMFQKNEAMYGVQSTFDQSLAGYTVQLQKSDSTDFRRRELEAEKIAREIEKQPAYDERADLENGDEEAAFAAVVRPTGQSPHTFGGKGSGGGAPATTTASQKYVPPAKRKQGQQQGKLITPQVTSPAPVTAPQQQQQQQTQPQQPPQQPTTPQPVATPPPATVAPPPQQQQPPPQQQQQQQQPPPAQPPMSHGPGPKGGHNAKGYGGHGPHHNYNNSNQSGPGAPPTQPGNAAVVNGDNNNSMQQPPPPTQPQQMPPNVVPQQQQQQPPPNMVVMPNNNNSGNSNNGNHPPSHHGPHPNAGMGGHGNNKHGPPQHHQQAPRHRPFPQPQHMPSNMGPMAPHQNVGYGGDPQGMVPPPQTGIMQSMMIKGQPHIVMVPIVPQQPPPPSGPGGQRMNSQMQRPPRGRDETVQDLKNFQENYVLAQNPNASPGLAGPPPPNGQQQPPILYAPPPNANQPAPPHAPTEDMKSQSGPGVPSSPQPQATLPVGGPAHAQGGRPGSTPSPAANQNTNAAMRPGEGSGPANTGAAATGASGDKPEAKKSVLNPAAKDFVPRNPSTPKPSRPHTPQSAGPPMVPGGVTGVMAPMSAGPNQGQSSFQRYPMGRPPNTRMGYAQQAVQAATGSPLTMPQMSVYQGPAPQHYGPQHPQPYMVRGVLYPQEGQPQIQYLSPAQHSTTPSPGAQFHAQPSPAGAGASHPFPGQIAGQPQQIAHIMCVPPLVPNQYHPNTSQYPPQYFMVPVSHPNQ